MNAILRTALAAASVTALLPAASAAPIGVRFQDWNFEGDALRFSVRHGGSSATVQAGEFRGLVDPMAGAPRDDTFSFTSFCIELAQQVDFGRWYDTYAVQAPAFGASQASLLDRLYTNALGSARSGGAVGSAAFQLVVWEVAGGDAHLNLNGGNGFKVESTGSLRGDRQAAFELASGWITQLNRDDWRGSGVAFQRLASGTQQDQLVVGKVALPGTMALLAAAGLGVAMSRRASRGARQPDTAQG